MAREGLRGAQVVGLGARRTALGSRSSMSPKVFGAVGEPGRQRAQRLRQRVGLLAVQAAGQGQLADGMVSDPLCMRLDRGQVAPRRLGLAAMEPITATMP